MSDDKFFNRLREDAQRLRYEPEDDVMWTRLASRISDRVQMQAGVTHLLAAWFRPIAASLAALSLAAVLTVQWTESAQTPTVEAMATASAPLGDLTIDGETLSVD